MEKLKPCPFCGGKVELILPYGESYPQVCCPECNTEVSVRYGKQAIIDKWNCQRAEAIARALAMYLVMKVGGCPNPNQPECRLHSEDKNSWEICTDCWLKRAECEAAKAKESKEVKK